MGEDATAVSDALIEAVTGGRLKRTSGPGKGRKSDVAHLLIIAIQALQTAREAVLKVRADMPRHERDRLLIPVVSDAGLAGRSVEEAIERMEAGKL